MTDSSRQMRLKRLLTPGSIVFVGDADLEPAIACTRALGFGGELHAISPRSKQLAGIDCARSASELDRPPDVALVALPSAATIDAVRDLSAAGVGAAIVHSKGFSEPGEDGAALENHLMEAAGDMPLMGSTCAGITSFLDRFCVMLDPMGGNAVQRGVAVLANNRAWLTDIAASDRSLPIAMVAGLGNQASLSIAELLEVILDDDRVSAVNLHLESIRDVARLSECALKAHHKGIPVVALAAGRSEAGKKAEPMRNDGAIVSALFERLGFVEIGSANEALETLKMLTLTAAPRGPRMGLISGSRTHAVMASNFAESRGLSVAPLSETTRSSLRQLMPDLPATDNPLVTGDLQLEGDELQRRVFDDFLADDFDIAVQTLSLPPQSNMQDANWYRSAKLFAAAAKAAAVPAAFVSSTQEGLPKSVREKLIDLGAVPLQGFEPGMQAIEHACSWYLRRRYLKAENLLLPEASLKGPAGGIPLDEAESKTLLDGHGIPIPAGHRVNAHGSLPQDLAFPVVLKLCDAAIPNKSELGGVSLNLANVELLRFAREQMIATLRQHGHAAQNFLIEESIHGGIAELLVLIRQVAGIGLALTLAIGGIAPELPNDYVNLLLPCDRDEIRQALERLKLYPILCGQRGGSTADIDAALDTIETLADFAQSRSDVVEVVVNPLILRAQDHGAVAVDAVIKIKPH